jgi:hypothetical protein
MDDIHGKNFFPLFQRAAIKAVYILPLFKKEQRIRRRCNKTTLRVVEDRVMKDYGTKSFEERQVIGKTRKEMSLQLL